MDVVKGPYLTGVSDTGIEVRFELAADHVHDRAFVKANPDGLEGDAGGQAIVGQLLKIPGVPSTMRVFALSGLTPATGYSYAVRVGGPAQASSAGGHFMTAPAPDSNQSVRFLAYGDDRTDPAAHATVVQAMLHAAGDIPPLLINTGDLVEDGARAADWQSFFDIEAPLLRDRPMFVAIGNHELLDDAAGTHFAQYFGFPAAMGLPPLYGTARYGDVRFFFLNSLHDWSTGEEREWLTHALEQADHEPGLRWRVAVTHFGPYSVGPHGPNLSLREAHIPELLEQHGVDLLLAGHDHIYDRGAAGRLNYIVTGGGGAPLYRVVGTDPTMRKAEPVHHFIEVTASADDLRAVAVRADGSVLERCGFKKGETWDCDAPGMGASPLDGSAVEERTDRSLDAAPAPTASKSTAHGSCAAFAPDWASHPRLTWAGAFAILITLGLRRRR